jgi:hypothetical protein
MLKPVIYAVRESEDRRTANIKDFTLNSVKNQFKVFEEGSGTFEFSASGMWSSQKLSIDIEHNLQYQPQFFAQMKGPSGEWQIHPVVNTGSTGPTKWCTGIARLDEDTIRLYAYIFDPTLAAYSAFDVEYEYLIFSDPNEDAWS